MFPNEIWDKILSFLTTDVKSFLLASQVCTTFRSLLSKHKIKVKYEFSKLPLFLLNVTSTASFSLAGNFSLTRNVSHVEIFTDNITIEGDLVQEVILHSCIGISYLNRCDVNLNFYFSGITFPPRTSLKCIEQILFHSREKVEKITSANYYDFDRLPFGLVLPNLRIVRGYVFMHDFISLCPKLEKLENCTPLYCDECKELNLSILGKDVYLSDSIGHDDFDCVLLLNRIRDVKKAISELKLAKDYVLHVDCSRQEILVEVLRLLQKSN